MVAPLTSQRGEPWNGLQKAHLAAQSYAPHYCPQ